MEILVERVAMAVMCPRWATDLAYRDQISGTTAATAVGAFPSFTLYRHLVDPDASFTQRLRAELISPAPVSPAVSQFTDALDFTAENVLAENIF